MQSFSLLAMLHTCRNLPWDSALYVNVARTTLLTTTRCLVLTKDEDERVAEEAEVAQEAEQVDFEGRTFGHFLNIDIVQSVMTNIENQCANSVPDEVAVQALEHYYHQDAFLQLGQP